MENSYNYTYPGTTITIQDVQNIELEMMIEFDRICRKYNIPYQMYGGTLLGAVRHKGFIPWDDDIDVAMLREDYNKFIRIAKEELDPTMFLQTCFTDPESIIQFAKIRKNGTIYEYNMDVGAEYHKGIWMDIFPFDNVKLDKVNVFIMSTKIKFLYAWTTSSVRTRINSAQSIPRRIIRRIMHVTGKIVKKQNIDKMLQKEFTKFSKEQTEYVTSLTNGITRRRFNIPERSKYKDTNLQKAVEFQNVCELEFCNHKFLAARNYEKVLTDICGNYMKLPPTEERIPSHEIVRLEL